MTLRFIAPFVFLYLFVSCRSVGEDLGYFNRGDTQNDIILIVINNAYYHF